ncbi:MAG: thioesterase domain-containing protein, partial [Marivita sp.]|uniref:thioesterase domain-containing protein n=1 Tax=Marivita sp. TaxID=2003365 RepID=UPI003EF61703
PLRAVFAHPTVRALAREVGLAQAESRPYDPLLPLRTDGTERPLFCIHPSGGSSTVFTHLTDNLPNSLPVYGMQAKSLSMGGIGHASICDMAACYIEAMRKVQPEGPYRLLGWSLGGVVAQEMAAQLEAQGATLEIVLLLDSGLSGDDFTNADPVDEAGLLWDQAEAIGVKPAGLSMGALKEAIVLEGKRTGLIPPQAEVADLDAILSAMQQAPALMASWSGCQQLNTAVTFVRASDNQRSDLSERLAQLTTGEVHIANVTAPHKKMCDTANSTDVARIVNMALRLKQ